MKCKREAENKHVTFLSSAASIWFHRPATAVTCAGSAYLKRRGPGGAETLHPGDA